MEQSGQSEYGATACGRPTGPTENGASSSTELAAGTITGQFELAQSAIRAGDFVGAERTLRLLGAISDGVLRSHHHHLLGIVLQGQGRLEEAAECALSAALSHPQDAALHARYSSVLLLVGKPAEAQKAAEQALSIRPCLIEALDALAEALRAQGRWAEAASPAREAAILMPEDLSRTHRLAQTLIRAGNSAEAEAVLRAAKTPDDRTLAGHHHHLLGIALQGQGRIEEAIASARLALRAEPHNEHFNKRLAALLAANSDSEANDEPSAGAEVDPPAGKNRQQPKSKKHQTNRARQDQPHLINRLLGRTWRGRAGHSQPPSPGATRQSSGLVLDATPDDPDALSAAVVKSVGLTARDLVMRYDSLGDNCELGFVQRAFDAEPLSLTRFGEISLEEMCRALDARFEGLTEATNLIAEGEDKWDIRDRRYNLAYHTFIGKESASAEEIIAEQSRRLDFLRTKFLNDIAGDAKTFTLWRRRRLTDSEVNPIFDALRRHGPAWMLYLVESEPIGHVEVVQPGLMRGHIDRLAPNDATGVPSLRGWLTVLMNAWILHH